MANYVVDPAILLPHVPVGTELDFWISPGESRKRCYVSLVGFLFINTRIRGFKIPFHVNFEEINLRFYVRYRDGDSWKRGVVFIKEIVSKRMVSFIANTIYNENYCTLPTEHSWIATASVLNVEYRWKKANWNVFRIAAEKTPTAIKPASEEEFILEHYWGYAKADNKHSFEYQVGHPRWEVYPMRSYRLEVDFGDVYGAQFGFLSQEKPVSVFLAEGSEIAVHWRRMF